MLPAVAPVALCMLRTCFVRYSCLVEHQLRTLEAIAVAGQRQTFGLYQVMLTCLYPDDLSQSLATLNQVQANKKGCARRTLARANVFGLELYLRAAPYLDLYDGKQLTRQILKIFWENVCKHL